jgi:hypothetical protein
MVSAIDSTKPADGLPSVKADLRANLEAARTEIEALQTGKADKPINFATDIASATANTLCGMDSGGDPQFVQVGSGLAYSSGVLSATGTATPSLVAATPTAGVYALSDAVRFLANNVVLSTNTNNTDVEVPENYLTSGQVAIFQVLVNNSGCTVSIHNDPSGRVLNGVTNGGPIALGPAGSTVWIIALPSNVVRVEGETAEARTLLNNLDASGFDILNIGQGSTFESASATRSALGAQASDAELTAIAGLTSAADKLPYFTGSGTAALADFTSTARSLLDDTSVSAMRTTLQIPEVLTIAVSDETTALTTGTAKVTFRMPFAMTLTAVRASVTAAPTGSTIIVNIKESGTTVLGTKLSIDATEKTSKTAASAATITDSALADDAEITIDIDQVGSTVSGAGLKVQLHGTRA